MTTLATLVVKLVGDTADLQKSMNETNGIVENSTGKMGAFGGVLKGGLIAGVGVAVGGLAALGAGLYSAVSEAMAAEEVTAQLNAVLESTGGVAGVTASMATGLADSLSGVTRFEDDAILAGENLLLTFTNIGSDVFPMATETMLNMSQALGQDMSSSAVQLGKALNDPVQGMTALSRVGVSFTEEQKATIKSLQESGDLMGAQGVILAELEKEFGGAAVAAGQTFAGQLDIMKNSLGNVKEEVGMALLPALTTLAQTLGPVLLSAAQGLAQFLITTVVPALSTLFQWLATNLPLAIQALALFWTNTLKPALQAVWSFIQTSVIPILQQVFAWLATNLPPALQTLARFWTGTLQPALAAVWAFIQNSVIPILQQVFAWLAANLPPALQALAQFWTGTLQPALAAVWAFIQTSVIPILQQVFAWLATNLPPAIQALADFWQNILKPAIEAVWSFISTYLVPLFEALVNVHIAAIKLALAALALVWNTVLKPALTELWDFLRDRVIAAFVDLKAKLDGPVNTALQTFRNLLAGPVASALGIFQGAIDAVAGAIRGIIGAINSVLGWIQSLIDKINSIPSLPGWLTPGSPTPFEMGLRGIASALGPTASEMAGLSQELERLGGASRDAASGLALIGMSLGTGGDGTGDDGADLFEQLRSFLERMQSLAKLIDAAGLEPAKLLAEAAGKIGQNVQAAIAGIQAAMMFEVPKMDNTDILFEALRKFVARLQTVASLMDYDAFGAAMTLAEAAGKIGGQMQAAIDGIKAAMAFRLDRSADGTDLLFETMRRFVAKLQTVASLMDYDAFDAAVALAEAAGKIGQNVQAAIDGILAAMNFRMGRMADGTDLFISQMALFVGKLIDAGRLFDEDGLKAATALAEAAGRIGKSIEDAILGMTATAKYAGLDLVQGARLFAEDTATLVRELVTAALGFDTAGLNAATDFANAAGAIGDQIESAIAGMKATMDYAGGLAATAVTRLATDLLTMVDGLVRASGMFDGKALAAAQGLAEAAGAIGGSISATVEGLKAIMAYAGGLTQTAIDRFVVDLQLMVAGLQNAAFFVSEKGLAAAVKLAEAAQVIGEGVLSMTEAMASLVKYVAPNPARLDEFAADVYSMIEKLRIVASVLGDDAIKQALNFALAGAAIYQAIEDGIDSILGINEAGSMAGVGVALNEMVNQVVLATAEMALRFSDLVLDANKFGAGWVDAIIDGLTSRLGDLEALMAYIRGLFPSSPAEHGAWQDLPDGQAVGEAFTASMAGAVASGSASVAEALAGLRSAFGMAPEGSAAAGGMAGGLQVTVNVNGDGDPARVRDAANLGVMEAARALGWA